MALRKRHRLGIETASRVNVKGKQRVAELCETRVAVPNARRQREGQVAHAE